MENVLAFKIPTMLTIKETAQKTGVAAYQIRQLAIGNQIVHVRCGRKILINLEKFVDFLNSSTGIPEDVPQNKFNISPVKV